MFKLYVLDALSVDVGPQFGFLMNAKSKMKADEGTVTADIEDTNGFDMSVGLGLSYKISERFDVSARYNLGLTKVLDIEEEKVKNGVIQLGVGYRF